MIYDWNCLPWRTKQRPLPLDLMQSIRHLDTWMRMESTPDLIWNWLRRLRSLLGAGKDSDRLGFQGYGAEFRSDRLHLNGFTMNGREDDYTWSMPYVDNSQVIVIPEDSDIADLAGLAGKTVGVQAASAVELLSDGSDQADLAATFGTLPTVPGLQ